ncbi:MAG: dipeptidase [Gemmatimonadota bacterium]
MTRFAERGSSDPRTSTLLGRGPAALATAVLALLLAAPALQAQEVSEEAQRIHEEATVVDGHNDLPWRIRSEAGLEIGPLTLDQRNEEGHTDLPRLEEGGIDVQWWSTYVDPDIHGPEATAVELEQIDVTKRLCRTYPQLEMAYTPSDVRRINDAGRTACLIGIEGGHIISNSIPVLRQLYEAGARYLTLTHFRSLSWADAAGDVIHGGLTEFGEEVVREMNRLGMVVDLSHVSDQTMSDALRVSEAPVIFSHSGARALADHPRNVPDRILRRLDENGGVVMVIFYPGYLVPGADTLSTEYLEQHTDVGTIADHIDHIVEVAGIDHVGLGSDFDGVSYLPRGMKDVSDLPNLTQELLDRGYTEEEIRKILGGNAMRVFREAHRVGQRLQEERDPAAARLPHYDIVPGDTAGGG